MTRRVVGYSADGLLSGLVAFWSGCTIGHRDHSWGPIAVGSGLFLADKSGQDGEKDWGWAAPARKAGTDRIREVLLIEAHLIGQGESAARLVARGDHESIGVYPWGRRWG